MNTAGIIAEYNPFHNGHNRQLAEVRALGAERIAVVMSGNFVQRGEPAAFSKWARAEAALRCGADVVCDLPTPFAVSPAQTFAAGGVALLVRLGVDTLCFGSECGDTALLWQTLEAVEEAESHPRFGILLRDGVSHPAARQQVVRELYGDTPAEILRAPNNLLGIEYLRAAKAYPGLHCHALPRRGTGHDSTHTADGIASASHLRRLLHTGGLEAVRPFLPEEAYHIFKEEAEAGRAPASLGRMERALLASLRGADAGSLRQTADLPAGMEHRILKAVRSCCSFDEILEACVCKSYTRARVRRILLSHLLGLRREDTAGLPGYARILGCTSEGAKLLREASRAGGIPVTPKFAQLRSLPGAQLESRMTDLYGLACPDIQPCLREFREAGRSAPQGLFCHFTERSFFC